MVDTHILIIGTIVFNFGILITTLLMKGFYRSIKIVIDNEKNKFQKMTHYLFLYTLFVMSVIFIIFGFVCVVKSGIFSIALNGIINN